LAPERACGKFKNMHPAAELSILAQILVIDLSLAGDNAIVIGMAANGLPAAQRRRAIWTGLGAATVLRIGLAIFAVQLLHLAGLALAGGLLLMWVAWKMYRDLQRTPPSPNPLPLTEEGGQKKLSAAILKILVADLGMSLDNILAVAGAARDHYAILALGLILSVALMGFAATAAAKMLHRWPWLGWLGMAVVAFVAVRMIWDGGQSFWQQLI
jgi:YjbE family integral membrane protein